MPVLTHYLRSQVALAEGDFAAVDLMLPHHLHLPLSVLCFNAGKHVLLEKPLAAKLDDALKLLAAGREAVARGQVFMVAENSQYWNEVRCAKAAIEKDRIGEVLSARAIFNGTFTEGDDARTETADVTKSYATLDGEGGDAEKPWRFDAAATGGGICIDGGAHWIRPLRILMGSEIKEVIGVCQRPFDKMEGESLGRALLRFESGRVAYFEATLGEQVYGPDQSWRVLGTKGEIVVDGDGVRLYSKEHAKGLELFETPPEYQRLTDLGVDISFEGLAMPLAGYHASFGHELADFADVCCRGATPSVPTDSKLSQSEHALGEMCTALALYRSAKTNTWEAVWPQTGLSPSGVQDQRVISMILNSSHVTKHLVSDLAPE